jgi:nicotinamidase-related amidase
MIAVEDAKMFEPATPVAGMALLVIDMQNDGMRIVPPGQAIVSTVKRVLEGFREKRLPVIFKVRVQRPDGIDVERFRIDLFRKSPFLVEGTPGAAIVAPLAPRDGEYIVKGARFSGFFQTDLQLILTRLGVETLVVCGMQTPNCIRATVTDAIAYDYHVIVVKDAVTTMTPAIHEANLLDMQNMGVAVMSAQVLLASLEDGAGAPA